MLPLIAECGTTPRFYDDDPIEVMPLPDRVDSPRKRKLDNLYDFMMSTFTEPGERQRPGVVIPAQAINTLGEAPDSTWYTNRHWKRRMTIKELVAGPGVDSAPAKDSPWQVIKGKAEGVTPGMTIRDSRGRSYMLKFDPLDYPELASAADVIGSKFFYALGYNVPEYYIVSFERSQLVPDPKSRFVDSRGRERAMEQKDIDELLSRAPRNTDRQYRAVASLMIPGDVGPFRFHGIRKDDPNDVVPHEHRRDLRGLAVFCAWLGHNDAKSLNSMDALVEHDGLRYIRHYLIDFGGILGSDSFTIKSPRAGNEYMFSWRHASLQFLSLGLYVPDWMRADYPRIRGVGRFESKIFDPQKWKPNYPIPAFLNRLPDDEFWAAKQVMAFTDEEIRAMVKTGEFSDPRAVEWLTKVLCERRDKIGRAYFNKVLPVDRFRVEENRLRFEYLDAAQSDKAGGHRLQWHDYDNSTGELKAVAGATSEVVPAWLWQAPEGSFAAVSIHAGDASKTVTVFVRKQSLRSKSAIQIVGIDRKW